MDTRTEVLLAASSMFRTGGQQSDLMKVAVLRLFHESNTFCPLVADAQATTIESRESQHTQVSGMHACPRPRRRACMHVPGRGVGHACMWPQPRRGLISTKRFSRAAAERWRLPRRSHRCRAAPIGSRSTSRCRMRLLPGLQWLRAQTGSRPTYRCRGRYESD